MKFKPAIISSSDPPRFEAKSPNQIQEASKLNVNIKPFVPWYRADQYEGMPTVSQTAPGVPKIG